MRGVAFAANATYGAGGQGEFLRQMVHALQEDSTNRVYARDPGGLACGITVPQRRAMRAALGLLRATPVLRGRDDWATLLYDNDFDAALARVIEPASVFDGVMGQCATASKTARRQGAAVVMTSLNTHIDDLARVLDVERARVGGGVRSFVHPAAVINARRQIASADWVRVNSRRAAQSFVERGTASSRVRVIHPAVDLSHFRPQPVDATAPLRVLAVGSIDMRKGPHYLLEAFAAARLPHATLTIIGGTGSRWARRLIERYRASRLALDIQQIDVSAVPAGATYGRASVLVHAALEDGWGLVVAQALACGRPVIVTEAAGAADLVEDGVNGFVVPAASSSAIRERLELLEADRALLARMCQAAPMAVATLGYEDFGREVRAFYQEAAA